jgi:site-specific DNA-cytosine methylase
LKLGCRGGVTPTLNAFDNANENRATVLIIDGTRVGDVRVYEDQVMQTVIQRWGTGGGNVPMIFEDEEPTTIAFDTQFGSNANTFENVSPTLKASQQPPSFIEVEAIAYSIREDAKANNFSATETDTALALQANQPSVQSHHAQIFIAQEEPIVMRDREGAAGGGKGPLVSNKAFTLATSNFHTIFPNSATVRRLTPTECERLQGFPDGWTAEQADSNRYKQMGNAVAVPVVQWIINNVVGNE